MAGVIPEITLGTRLRVAREYAGLQQGDLSERIGVSPTSIGAAENNKSKPRRSTVILWAMATGVDFDWLMSGHEKTPGPDGPGESVARPEGFEPPTF
ncbi:helix-turn-helix domain-containing protein [Dermabacteraceae bacterium P7006]